MIRASVYFAGGILGGFTNSLFVWLVGASGITALLGIAIAPTLTPAWLYPRLVWGGLWGLLFLLPILKNSKPITRAALFMLFPTIVQLCIVLPFKAEKGFFGLELGILTPLLVVTANFVWAYTVSLWGKTTLGEPD